MAMKHILLERNLVFASPYLAEMCKYITEAKFSDYLPVVLS